MPLPPRKQRRQAERTQKKLLREKERLWSVEPGGSFERPIQVDSAAVVESHARSLACLSCNGEVRVESHEATPTQAAIVRTVRIACKRCGHTRCVYIAVLPPRTN